MALPKVIADEISPEAVRNSWNKICHFNHKSIHPESAQGINSYFAKAIQEMQESNGLKSSDKKDDSISPAVNRLKTCLSFTSLNLYPIQDKALDWNPVSVICEIKPKDIILYAISGNDTRYYIKDNIKHGMILIFN